MERRVGGKGGGASKLTDEILELMEQFLELRNQVNKEADRCFDACFNKI
jgi:molybdate transport repressor ModE-like protein